MNEVVKLSNDLNVITAEINSYKQVAGQAIFEIGRRLKHVKENDLVHGEFGKWLESVDMTPRHAQRFMKVYEELPNTTPVSHLGIRALYEMATLPEEEREKEHTLPSGETKTVNEMTVRELQEVKKQLKEAEQANEKLGQLLAEERSKDVEVIEREVYPDDYDYLKGSYASLEKTKDFYKQQNEELKEALKTRGSDFSKGGDNAESYKRLSHLKEVSNELIKAMNQVKQSDDLKKIDFQTDVVKEIELVVNDVEKVCFEMKSYMDNKNIIEGVFSDAY